MVKILRIYCFYPFFKDNERQKIIWKNYLIFCHAHTHCSSKNRKCTSEFLPSIMKQSNKKVKYS